MLRVLTFGWEFAPLLSGGLGVACAGLGRALARLGVEMTFVLPRLPRAPEEPNLRVLSARDFGPLRETRTIETLLAPYRTPEGYLRVRRDAVGSGSAEGALYGRDLFAEVERYAEAASRIAAEVPHDVIHCHDWMTFEAGIRARAVSGRPLVLHVHSTELDRTGGHGAHPDVHARERRGFEEADRIVAVSRFTRGKIVDDYGIAPERIAVVHNGIDGGSADVAAPAISTRHPIVLFLGRLTIQKGPDWFLEAARRVVERDPSVLFVIAGTGDMEPMLIERVADVGLERNVLFAGFLAGEDVDRAYRMAAVYVMPSVSEPFGLTPLEAMQRGTPVILSRQSGVSEVVSHCLKVDFWDTEDVAAKILGVLAWREVHDELAENGRGEVRSLSWSAAARKVLEVYRDAIGGRS